MPAPIAHPGGPFSIGSRLPPRDSAPTIGVEYHAQAQRARLVLRHPPRWVWWAAVGAVGVGAYFALARPPRRRRLSA